MLCDAVNWADVMVEYKCLELFEVSGSNANIVRLEEVSKEELEVAERDERCDRIFEQRCAVDTTPIQRIARFVCHAFFRERVDEASTRASFHQRLSSAQAGIRQIILASRSPGEQRVRSLYAR
jgi:hypothetical protein